MSATTNTTSASSPSPARRLPLRALGLLGVLAGWLLTVVPLRPVAFGHVLALSVLAASTVTLLMAAWRERREGRK